MASLQPPGRNHHIEIGRQPQLGPKKRTRSAVSSPLIGIQGNVGRVEYRSSLSEHRPQANPLRPPSPGRERCTLLRQDLRCQGLELRRRAPRPFGGNGPTLQAARLQARSSVRPPSPLNRRGHHPVKMTAAPAPENPSSAGAQESPTAPIPSGSHTHVSSLTHSHPLPLALPGWAGGIYAAPTLALSVYVSVPDGPSPPFCHSDRATGGSERRNLWVGWGGTLNFPQIPRLASLARDDNTDGSTRFARSG